MRSTRPLTGRYCEVTSATRDIGLAAASALADRAARVLLDGRDERRLAESMALVRDRARSSGAPAPLARVADLSTASGVRGLVQSLRDSGEPIDVLLNSAGAMFPHRGLTIDGVQGTFALNHLAVFALTLGVKSLLEAAVSARIVTVSSEAHRAARPPFDDWESKRRYTPMSAYARSKLANILFTRALARRLEGSSITANCFHPGLVRTGFAGDARGVLRLLFSLSRPFMRSPERGAPTEVYLAVSNDVSAVSGGYFADERLRSPSAAARDDVLGESLWKTSDSLVEAQRGGAPRGTAS